MPQQLRQLLVVADCMFEPMILLGVLPLVILEAGLRPPPERIVDRG